MIAAEVGYHDAALDYFHQSLYVDLADLHHNTVDGLHVASTGGVWSALVNGFGGLRDYGGELSFDPRLPATWPSLTFRLCWRGSRMLVELTQEQVRFSIVEGDGKVPVTVRGTSYVVAPDAPIVVPLPDQGDRIDGLLGDRPVTGGTRADGSRITAGVPEPIQPPEEMEHTGEIPAYVPDPPMPPI